MGFNVSKTPFNLAEFLSQPAPKRPYKKKGPTFGYRQPQNDGNIPDAPPAAAAPQPGAPGTEPAAD